MHRMRILLFLLTWECIDKDHLLLIRVTRAVALEDWPVPPTPTCPPLRRVVQEEHEVPNESTHGLEAPFQEVPLLVRAQATVLRPKF